ncbi:HEPN domain-containing protein [Ichthyenterobacterium sp. W332]|uniref:HEPN domain-containing protein n=1 Tax=Microcosmobacter mediterraneus TaxID=3075607 RepID=A0ABU2YGC0_9FLAO|nr:HEPN domain-containing protein [Ichthyenterobacterium sp. W332]MDT0557225.1 HEPN domain-containing protein [Ichthyenterobacterium sp. W332]
MTISERLFETAKQDLDSVELLYNSGQYNLALFQLQQSVEKFVKSFGLKTEVIESKDIAKKINHLPHKVFTRLYQRQIDELSKYSGTPLLIPDMVPPHQRGKSKVKENVESLKKMRSEILNFAELNKKNLVEIKDIKKFIKSSEELEAEPTFDDDKLFAETKDDFVKTHEHMIEYFKGDENIKSISEDLIKNSNEIAKNKVKIHKQERIRERKFGYISYVWINLSLITSPHEQSTRYPSIENESNPINQYDQNHVLIKHIPEFIKMMKKTIIKYKEVYNNYISLRTTTCIINYF